ncbi:MAG: hypothetical protein L6R39_005169 [Caloplaca ligustica]|nr:MAG: hypothetical protein L6R39_005169 [Caloplaca ligustica]
MLEFQKETEAKEGDDAAPANTCIAPRTQRATKCPYCSVGKHRGTEDLADPEAAIAVRQAASVIADFGETGASRAELRSTLEDHRHSHRDNWPAFLACHAALLAPATFPGFGRQSCSCVWSWYLPL